MLLFFTAEMQGSQRFLFVLLSLGGPANSGGLSMNRYKKKLCALCVSAVRIKIRLSLHLKERLVKLGPVFVTAEENARQLIDVLKQPGIRVDSGFVKGLEHGIG